jgi:predicted nucleic acid-binding protein
MSSSMICVDASAIVRMLTSGARDTPVVTLWREWHEARRTIVAPTLLYYEVSNALHRYVVHSELLSEEATEAMEAALALGITLYGDADLHRRALKLADRFALPATYDAHYLALAKMMGAEFWTADRRLVKAVSADLPWVHKVEG